MRFEELTATNVKGAARRVLIVPVGAVEAHGPHLPLSADLVQPLAAAEEVAKKTGALLAPPIPYGLCVSTRPFPGTISVSFDALRAYMRDILDDFVRTGFRRILVLSGHAGRDHMAALRVAATEVADRTGAHIAVLSDYDLLYGARILPPTDGHGGMGETSRVMAIAPDLVKDRPRASRKRPPPYTMGAAQGEWEGYVGAPAKASAAKGRKLNDYVVRELVKIVRSLEARR